MYYLNILVQVYQEMEMDFQLLLLIQKVVEVGYSK